MNVLSVSCGNDSVALVQWVIENLGDEPCVAVYCNTGWCSSDWFSRVREFSSWCNGWGIPFVELKSKGMEEAVRAHNGFPIKGRKWCTKELKIRTTNRYLREVDPKAEATIYVGVRRCESPGRAMFPRMSVNDCGRDKIAPLVLHTDSMRNDLITRAGFEILPHRSRECFPCILSDRPSIADLTEREISRIEVLEGETGNTFFVPSGKGGARGIREVIKWAKSGHGKYHKEDDCSSGFCEA